MIQLFPLRIMSVPKVRSQKREQLFEKEFVI